MNKSVVPTSTMGDKIVLVSEPLRPLHVDTLHTPPSTPPAHKSPTILSPDPVDITRDQVLHEISVVLHQPAAQLDLSRSFVRHGGDSIAASQVRNACQKKMGISLSMGTMLGAEKLSDIIRESQIQVQQHYGPWPRMRDNDRNNTTVTATAAAPTVPTTSTTTSTHLPILIEAGVPATLDPAAVTEMQIALIEGSRQNPGMNIIRLRDQCASQMVPVMKAAWISVLSSEPIFRAFCCNNKTSSSSPSSSPSIAVTVEIDWSEVATYDAEAFEDEVHRPSCIDSNVGSSFKVVTLRKGSIRQPPYTGIGTSTSTSTSTIIWSVHHALVDGYSARLLYDKVLRLISNQEPHTKPGTSFFDVSPQLRRLQNKSRETTNRFWNKVTENHPSVAGGGDVQQALLHPPPPFPPDDGAALTRRVGFGTASVSMIGVVDPVSTPSRCGVSVAALFHAAWALVLSLHLDSDQVTFGAVLSGRSLPLAGVEDTIGPLINTLPFFANIDPALSTGAFLRGVFQQLIDLDAVQYSTPQDGYSRAFSTVLAEELELPASPFSGGVPPAFDMASDIPLRVLFTKTGRFRICYDAQLYRASHAQAMAECLRKAVLCLLAPGSLDKCLAQLVSYDTREMLKEMGNCFSEATAWSSVHDDLVTLFERAAGLDREAVALEQDGVRLTYGELDQLAGHVSSVISPRISAGDTVCVSADGSINWIVAIYAILKAGGVYSALSNKLPSEVRDENFHTAGANMFLVPYTKDKATLRPASCSSCLSIEELLVDGPRQSWNHRTQPIPWADAYICFTSGSTGKPKGVICTHAGLVAFQRDPEVRLFANPGTRVAQLMSPAFDGSIHEIFSTLSYGATLVLGPKNGDISHLHHVDSILSTPSMVKELRREDFPLLKQLYMVGEKVPQSVNDAWASSANDGSAVVKVYNMYGPTEATCGATIKRLRPGQKVNVGQPNASTRLYVLDRRGRRLVLPGVVGEVYIGGVQVSRGYVGARSASQETKDESRFCIDHVSPHSGEMMYRTGDRGFWNGRGEMELLGRSDRQIKLRGYRVDLDDLEIRIGRLAAPNGGGGGGGGGVVAVTSKDDYLVAMVQPEDTDLDALKARVTEAVPVHCLPKYYVAVDKIPLTPVGKIDYKAVAGGVSVSTCRPQSLPLSRSYPRAAATGKLGEMQMEDIVRAVAGVWREVLGLEDGASPLHEESNFVALGGYSLRQMMVANRLSQVLSTRVTHAQVFQAASLGDLARSIIGTTSGGNKHDDSTISPSVSAVATTAAYSLSPPIITTPGQLAPIEKDWWRKYQENTGTSAFNLSFVCELDPTAVDASKLADAWDTVLGRHSILGCRYKKDCQGKVTRVYIDAPRVRRVLEGSCSPSSGSHIREEINREFDLSSEPLVRVTVSPKMIIVVISHIICDLTTLQVLLSEVRSLYLGLSLPFGPQRGYELREWWDRPVFPSDLGFWRQNLRDLPTSRLSERKRLGYRHGRSAVFKLPPSVAQGFVDICYSGKRYTSHQVAMAAVALALWSSNLSTPKNKEKEDVIDVVLGGPYLGRGIDDLETVGLFLEPIPFRFRTKANPILSATSSQDGDDAADLSTNNQHSGNIREQFLDVVKDASQKSLSHAIPWVTLIDALPPKPLSSTSIPPITNGEQPVRDQENETDKELLDVMVTYHPLSTATLPVPEGLHPLATWTEGAKFKLMCEFTELRGEEGEAGAMLRMEWDTNVISDEEILAMRDGIWNGILVLAGSKNEVGGGRGWGVAFGEDGFGDDGDNYFGKRIVDV